MKVRTIIIISFMFAVSCNVVESDSIDKNKIQSTFIMTDTNNIEKTTFKTGEEFILSFKISNQNEQTLHYTHTPPIISYSIMKNDSVISNSTDYMTYIQPVNIGELNKNEEFVDSWQGPSSKGRIVSVGKLELSEGSYKAIVNHQSFFDEYKIAKIKEIEFSVSK